MSLRKTENQVKDLLTETIVTLCRNTLNNYPDVSVEGLLGVTLNKQEIFLVSINQQIDNRKSQSEGLSGLISEIYNAKRKRQQNERSDGESESSDNEAHYNAELKLESNDAGGAPCVKRKRRRKRKNFSNSNSPTNFNVISDCTNSNGVAQERSRTSHHSQRQDLNNLGDSNNQGQSLEALGFAEIQKTSFLSSSNFEQDNADNLDAIDDVLSRELNDASEQLARLNKHQNDEECDSEIPHDITPHSPHLPGVSGVATNQIDSNENDSLGSIHAIVNVKIKTEKPDPEDSENEENPSNVVIKEEKRDTDGWPSLGEGSSGLANETIDDHGDSDGALHDGMGEDEAVPSSSNSAVAREAKEEKTFFVVFAGNRRKFKCATCDKLYNHKKNLQEHMLVAHGFGELPQCEVCGKRMAPSNMYRHKESHEKKTLCGICGIVIFHGHNLRRHMRTVHKVDH